MGFPLRILLCCVLLATNAGMASADSNPMRGPHSGSSRRPPLAVVGVPDYLAITRQPADAAGAGPFTAALNFYRTEISPVDGKRCEMAPTCSLYAQQAFKEQGVVMGFLLTADRLLHEADEQPQVRHYVQNGARHYV